MSEERFTVELREGESRYVLLDLEADEDARIIGEEEYVDVPDADVPDADIPNADGGVHRVLYHTWVADEYGGQGLASKLVRAVVEDAIASGRQVVPVCPYVDGWLRKHPEFSEHVVKTAPKHLQAIPQR